MGGYRRTGDVLVNAGKVREDERELVLDSIKQRVSKR